MDQKNLARSAIEASARAAIDAITRRESANKAAIHIKAQADRSATLHKAMADKAAL